MTIEGTAAKYFWVGADIAGLAPGADGNIWFAEGHSAGRIGRISPEGVYTGFADGITGTPSAITRGPNNDLWFLEDNGKIGRITTQGLITEFPTGLRPGYPYSITLGADGNLWFVQGAAIGRSTPQGEITVFQVQSADETNLSPGDIRRTLRRITAGSDGNLWFTLVASTWEENHGVARFSQGRGAIGRITPSGVITIITGGITTEVADHIIGTPDGYMWFTGFGDATKLDRVDMGIPPRARLQVELSLVPANDAGRFNLQVNGVAKATAVGDRGSTRLEVVSPGAYVVTATAAPGTNLADYSVTFGGDCDATGRVVLSAGDLKRCSVTNSQVRSQCLAGCDDVRDRCMRASARVDPSGRRPNDCGRNWTTCTQACP